MRHRAQKWTVGPERRKGLGTSRADVSGNARHFCDGELNFINKLKQFHYQHLQMYVKKQNKSSGHLHSGDSKGTGLS